MSDRMKYRTAVARRWARGLHPLLTVKALGFWLLGKHDPSWDYECVHCVLPDSDGCCSGCSCCEPPAKCHAFEPETA